MIIELKNRFLSTNRPSIFIQIKQEAVKNALRDLRIKLQEKQKADEVFKRVI